MLRADEDAQPAFDSHPKMSELAAVLKRNMRTDSIDKLQPSFAKIVWEIWVFAVGGSDLRRLDATVYLAVNDLRIAADRIARMDRFQVQASPKLRSAINSFLLLDPSELVKRADIKGRPTNAHADGLAKAVLKYYTILYDRAPSYYQDGDFVNLLAQIFGIFAITAKPSAVARKCLE